MTGASLNWRLTACLFAGMLSCVPLFKGAGIVFARRKIRERSLFYLIAPVWSKERLERARPASRAVACALLLHIAGAIGLLAAYYLVYWKVVAPRKLPVPVAGYFAAPVLLGWGEILGPCLQLALLPTGRVVPPLLREPWRMSCVSQFWGLRWNTWLNDFFREVFFLPLRRMPWIAVGAVFLFSGLLHEALIDLPFYVLAGKNLFGTQLLYFVLQAAAVAIDRRLLRHRLHARRVFAWLAVLGPAPLIGNEGLLRMVHLL